MTDSKYTKVYTGNFIMVQRLVIELKDQNINVIIKDETESGRLAGFGAAVQGQQDLYVTKDTEAQALQIIKAILEE